MLKWVNQKGFTIVELVLASVIFPFIVIGIATSFNSLRYSYLDARQLNQVYAVLSACPELDRALDYSILTSTVNCYPNNSFQAEDGYTTTITYSPTLSISDTSTLANSDPLKAIPDSKVVQVNVNLLKPYNTAPPVQLRMLITRNGIGQL